MGSFFLLTSSVYQCNCKSCINVFLNNLINYDSRQCFTELAVLLKLHVPSPPRVFTYSCWYPAVAVTPQATVLFHLPVLF